LSAWTDWLSSLQTGKNPCYGCRKKGNDRAGNNYHHYGEGKGGYCHACGFTLLSDDEKERRGLEGDVYEEQEEVSTKLPITDEENERIKGYTGISGKGYRGLRDEITKYFGVRYEYDQETGEPIKQFIPVTKDYKLVGYKTRKFPKDFTSPIGQTGKDCDLIGQFRFKDSNGILLIVGGEIKQLAAYQMFIDDQKKKGKTQYDPVSVVASSIGESGCAKQIANHYSWLCQFSKIVVCMDADDAGRAAAEEVCKVLPKGKAFVMSMRYKDPDEYIKQGKEDDFIKDFWKARQYTSAAIVDSDQIYEEIKQRALVDKLPFPPMLNKVNKALAGGVNYGYICNILAGSGSGKSSVINQCVSYWMKELDLNVGVLSLEAEAGEYGENLLSHYLGRKIALIQDRDERLAFVGSEEAEQAANSLFKREDGSSRLYLLDDRGDYTKLQEQIEELIIGCGCKIIVIDVISDIFSGKPIEYIDSWMGWQKKIVKEHQCIIFNVAHVRKSGSGEKSASSGAFLTEEQIIGSGTQYRSAGVNIALQRDKNNPDEILKNSTAVHILKSRSTGWTGLACELFYDSNTHTLWDKEEYMKTQNSGPTKF
jgi:archaellum biogenesis ATPase FlaH